MKFYNKLPFRVKDIVVDGILYKKIKNLLLFKAYYNEFLSENFDGILVAQESLIYTSLYIINVTMCSVFYSSMYYVITFATVS